MFGGARGNRTHDLLNANQAFSRLNYRPKTSHTKNTKITKKLIELFILCFFVVPLEGLEPPTY
jgi:hypothetical protein